MFHIIIIVIVIISSFAGSAILGGAFLQLLLNLSLRHVIQNKNIIARA